MDYIADLGCNPYMTQEGFHSDHKDVQPAFREGPLVEQASCTPPHSVVSLERSVAIPQVHHSGGQKLMRHCNLKGTAFIASGCILLAHIRHFELVQPS